MTQMPVDGETRLVTLIGYPVSHSLSPRIHNTAFAVQRLNWRYVVTPVRPSQLQEAIFGLKALNFAGANVTIPHKVDVFPWLDEVSDRARHVGAVNTIVVKQAEDETRLVGDNTDIEGFLAPLESYRDDLENQPVLIFGSGGAARAVVYGLLTNLGPSRVSIAARSLANAEQLALDMAAFDARDVLDVVSPEEVARCVRRSHLIVNATPLGMEPNDDGTPWPQAEAFSSESIVYDLVYAPRETRLLKDAAGRGARTIGGLEMLIAQAAAAYEQWTGQAMPTDAVSEALAEERNSHPDFIS